MRRRNERLIRPTRPNAGLEAEYRRRLRALTDELHASVLHWVRAAYRANEPELAQLAQDNQRAEAHHDDSAGVTSFRGGRQWLEEAGREIGTQLGKLEPHLLTNLALDEMPASALRDVLRRLTRRWRRRFEETAEDLARWFAKSVAARTDAALRRALREGGVSVEFRMTRAQRDVLRATVEANVSLIKSIPQRYLGEVEGLVMRSVQTGRDAGYLAKELEKRYGATRKRAALISRDQNNKATSSMTRARQIELGIREAVWMHSHAGKVPRPTHVKMHGKRYDVSRGMWDPAEGEFIFPGYLVNCRCTNRSVVPGFT